MVQETWARAIPKLESFRWESSLGTWLGAIALNCWRERKRRQGRETEWDASLEETVAGPPRRPGTGLDVARALDELPSGYRTVLVLFGVYGYSHAEIAALLGI